MVFGILSLGGPEQLTAESWGAGNQGKKHDYRGTLFK